MAHGRPEDQKLPVGNNLPHAHDMAMSELEMRKRLGIERYGQPLQPANGRDAVRGAYEEALDGAAYLAQVKWEQEHPEYTYVGVLLDSLNHLQFSPLDFQGKFVPQAVLDYLDKRQTRYKL